MNETKEKKARLQVIISVLVLTVVVFAEMYLMINFKESYMGIALLALVALIAVYVMSNALMALAADKEAQRTEHYENIFKSEKASYIMLKKSFDEIEEKLDILQESQQMPAQEIINAQKGIAKVIISRSKENAEAIISSNDQVLEKLDEVEETQNTKFTSLSKEQIVKLSDFGTQTDMKLQDLLMQLKDTELRLNQAIMNGTKVVIPAASSYAQSNDANTPFADPVLDSSLETEVLEEVLEETEQEASMVESNPVAEEVSVAETTPIEEEVPVEVDSPVQEEAPPMPDLSDPNRVMSSDEIAALIANL